MSILLSVNPPYAGWLVDGEKTIEWRKKPLPTGKAYIYETEKNGGCGKVIGEIDIINTFHVDVNRVGELAIEDGKVSRFDLQKYSKGKMIGLNFCGCEKRYETPLPLTEFKRPLPRCREIVKFLFFVFVDVATIYEKITRPPQSWMYAERG